jgi:hypothetical protein
LLSPTLSPSEQARETSYQDSCLNKPFFWRKKIKTSTWKENRSMIDRSDVRVHIDRSYVVCFQHQSF